MRRLVLSVLSINALGVGAALALALPAAPAAAQQWRNITCESWNYREAACPTPGAVRVQLLRVRGGQCIEGQSWIHDGSAIRVRNGCRAVFRTDSNSSWGTGGWDTNWNSGGNQGRWQAMRCESWNFRDRRCPVNGVISSARMLRVIAGDCRDGATWRWDRRAITVRGGCRAEFEVMQGSNGWGGNRPTTSFDCESRNYRQAQCPIQRGTQVRLARVLGGNCIEGRSWGTQAGVIWVKDGCRARFDIY